MNLDYRRLKHDRLRALLQALLRAGLPTCLTFASLLASPAWSAELSECDDLPKPSVTLKRLENGSISYNTEYGYRLLTSIGGEKIRPGSQVLGLTRTNSVAQFSVSTPSYKDATERYECASPQITLTLGFKQMTVYVGKEFPVGSCAYKEILDHEMRHVKAYQEHVTQIEKALQEDLNRRFATGSVWRGATGTSNARVSKELDERWLPYINRELQKVNAAQALIDAPEEYARLSNACNGEVKKLMK